MRVVLLCLALALAGCHEPSREAGEAGAASAGDAASFDALAVARAEDTRRAKDVRAELRKSHDVVARRRAARALARIGGEASLPGLTARLADEDAETVAWAAYGLGYACRGHEEAHVRMLVARAASLTFEPVERPRVELSPRVAVARAIGRCGAEALSEPVLVDLAKEGGAWTEPAVLGLGDLAARRKHLGERAMTELLELASPRGKAPVDLAFYPLSRVDLADVSAKAGAFAGRVITAARAALGRPGEARVLAIKTLAHAPRASAKAAAADLLRVATDAKGFTPAERAEAARGLGALGSPGRSAAAKALSRLTPDKDAVAIQALTGPSFHVLYTLIGALGPRPPESSEAALGVLSRIRAPATPKPGLARRLAELRCAAALGLARGVSDADVLVKCDGEGSEIEERARLVSLLRRPVRGGRLRMFRAFARSKHVRVREAAVSALTEHPELGDAAASILAEALASKHAGLVATAADVLRVHPDRAMVLAASERKAALDPRAPPPSAEPKEELASPVAKALGAALVAKWPADRFETRIALLGAAASVRHPRAKEAALRACADPNALVRERAVKALRALGESVEACEATPHDGAPAAEIGHVLDHATRVVFTTDVGELGIVLEPELSPVTATRIAALVRSGFYKGIVVHRVVPGFVVQFGDPGGDGFGGSGTPLRCETSPLPFGPLDVGMALAGRDTGSSQLFVTLARTPHLDGDYTRVGRAEDMSGSWAAVAEGDVIADARIAP